MSSKEEIRSMNKEQAIATFKELFTKINNWRLTYPQEWKTGIVGTYQNYQWFTCLEVIQDIDKNYYSEFMCTVFACHTFDIWSKIQTFGI